MYNDLIAALSAVTDRAALVERVAEQMCLLTPRADGAAVSILTPKDTFRVVSAHGIVQTLLGIELKSEGTLQASAILTRKPQFCTNAVEDRSLSKAVSAIAKSLGIRSVVVIPLLYKGSVIGTLSLTATQAHRFSIRDVDGMEALGQFVSVLIGSHAEWSTSLKEFLIGPDFGLDSTARFLTSVLLPEASRNHDLHNSLDDLLSSPSNMTAVFQPVVNLATEEIVGFEGLCRFPGNSHRTPMYWFDAARRLGRGVPLELAAARQILTAAEDLPPHCFVAVNVSPVAAMDPVVQDVLLSAKRRPVIEITEYDPFPDNLADELQRLRQNGIYVALDDVGAGYANLNQLLLLRPDMIKIDGALISDITNDDVKRSIVIAIVQLAKEMGAITVAEAVENAEERICLASLGVHLGQGFLFGHPSAWP